MHGGWADAHGHVIPAEVLTPPDRWAAAALSRFVPDSSTALIRRTPPPPSPTRWRLITHSLGAHPPDSLEHELDEGQAPGAPRSVRLWLTDNAAPSPRRWLFVGRIDNDEGDLSPRANRKFPHARWRSSRPRDPVRVRHAAAPGEGMGGRPVSTRTDFAVIREKQACVHPRHGRRRYMYSVEPSCVERRRERVRMCCQQGFALPRRMRGARD